MMDSTNHVTPATAEKDAGEHSPLLTICIPSYNRGERVKALIDYLSPLVEEFGGKVEIFASNNASKDNTEHLLGKVRCRFFRAVNRTVHLPTAEEHIFASAPLCRGEFVWFLGDDDVPVIPTLKALIISLESIESDFLFYNSYFMDAYGGHLGALGFKMNRDVLEGPFDSIAPALGFISTFAGLSNVVCRRALLRDDSWQDIVAVSYIYSHAVWWYLSFAGTKAVVINRPLVTYRQDTGGVVGHDFTGVSKKLGVGDKFFWSEGLIRLFSMMEDRDVISMLQIRNIWESRRDGTCFRLLDNITNTLFMQVCLGVSSDEARNRMPDDVVEYCCNWILKADPSYFECIRVLRLAHQATRMPKDDASHRLKWTEQDFGALFTHKLVTGERYIGVVGFYRGYDVYTHISGEVAIRRDAQIARHDVLRCIDPDDIGSDVVNASDSARLRQKIDDLFVRATRVVA